jgi:hypothetical protein
MNYTATTSRALARVTLRRACLIAAVLLAGACEDTPRPEPPIAPAPTPIPPLPVPTNIEYRVTGTHRDVTITYVTSTQGTTVLRTDLPWFLSYETLAKSTFVYLQAEGSTFNTVEGPLIVQIFVNGVLFRETRGQGLIPNVTASGEVVR